MCRIILKVTVLIHLTLLIQYNPAWPIEVSCTPCSQCEEGIAVTQVKLQYSVNSRIPCCHMKSSLRTGM